MLKNLTTITTPPVHSTATSERQSSAVKKRHAKIVMLILAHLFCFFIFKITTFENLLKRNSSQGITKISL